jgi:hypothetical protein
MLFGISSAVAQHVFSNGPRLGHEVGGAPTLRQNKSFESTGNVFRKCSASVQLTHFSPAARSAGVMRLVRRARFPAASCGSDTKHMLSTHSALFPVERTRSRMVGAHVTEVLYLIRLNSCSVCIQLTPAVSATETPHICPEAASTRIQQLQYSVSAQHLLGDSNLHSTIDLRNSKARVGRLICCMLSGSSASI